MGQSKAVYGIDLSGYSTGRSQVAKVIRIDSANDCYLSALIIPTDLLRKYDGEDQLITAIKSDVKVFSDLLRNDCVCAVDVPIDL